MEGRDDLFVINNAEEAAMQEEEVAPSTEEARETEAQALERVKGLVPLCVQHVHGPQLSNATFGYDIAQMTKRPWAECGAKLSDYFNYGFNEQSWRVYCAMQDKGETSLLAKATEMLEKLESTGRRANAAEDGAAAKPGPEMDMNMFRGPMDPYGGGGGSPNFYGGGNGRPFHGRDFHSGSMSGHGANYKTRLCKQFSEGRCARGDTCNYAHGTADLRQPGGDQIHPQQQGGYPMQPQLPAQGFPMPQPPPPQGYLQPPQQQQQLYGSGPAPSMGPNSGSPYPPMERAGNYLMPPSQSVAQAPPMLQTSTMVPQEGGDAGGGFRQPPKRQRAEGGSSVYEPQY